MGWWLCPVKFAASWPRSERSGRRRVTSWTSCGLDGGLSSALAKMAGETPATDLYLEARQPYHGFWVPPAMSIRPPVQFGSSFDGVLVAA